MHVSSKNQHSCQSIGEENKDGLGLDQNKYAEHLQTTGSKRLHRRQTQKERDGEIIHLAHHQQITGKVTYKILDREVFQSPNQPLK